METNYAVNISWDDEEAGFVATFPDFPYLSAFGDTWEEAVADARVVLDMTLEAMAEDGVPPPVPTRRPKVYWRSDRPRRNAEP